MNSRFKRQIEKAVGYLENVYLENPLPEAITLQEAVAYCYEYVNDDILQCGESKAIFFCGKKEIIEQISSVIKNNQYIKIKPVLSEK